MDFVYGCRKRFIVVFDNSETENYLHTIFSFGLQPDASHDTVAKKYCKNGAFGKMLHKELHRVCIPKGYCTLGVRVD